MQTYITIKNQLIAVSTIINAVSDLLGRDERIEAIDIDKYEYRYFVTDHGRVISAWNDKRGLKPLLIATNIHTYAQVSLYSHVLKKSFSSTVHTLVAEKFLHKPITGNFWVDHIDEDKANNHYLNLRYMTPRDNSRAYHIKRRGDNTGWSRKARPIIGFCVSGNGSYVTYATVNKVSRSGFNPVAVAHALAGRAKSSYAFAWRYLTDDEIDQNTYPIMIQ